jgi:GNAT superfamily N-acetyltransferase
VGESGRSIGTGTRPEYRNLGIATALRLRVVAWARARDLTMLHSASGNPAMVHVNEKLGFRRTATEVRLVRRLA